MTSIYRHALGADFDHLHPKMQWRFGLSADQHRCQIGTGTMDSVWHGGVVTVPFLMLGATRRLMFPDQGAHVPFTISNYAYLDGFGRETVTWSRHYRFPDRARRFDATMIYSDARHSVVDYLGDHQHLAVDIACSVDESGAMCLTSGPQRFYEGRVGFRFPRPLTGFASVREWWDAESARFGIDVRVRNPILGDLFGYRGSFTVEERDCAPSDIPDDVRPIREERRE